MYNIIIKIPFFKTGVDFCQFFIVMYQNEIILSHTSLNYIHFKVVYYLHNLFIGVILLIGQLADGFSTVFVGYFSDTKDDLWLCNKIGKRKYE